MADRRRRGPLGWLLGRGTAEEGPVPAARPERTVSNADIDEAIPPGIRIAGAWSWRILLMVGVAAVVLLIVVQLRLLVIPLFIAVLLSSLLHPAVNLLRRARVPRGLAIAISVLGTMAIVGGLVYLVLQQVVAESGKVRERTIESYHLLSEWLLNSPLHLTDEQIGGFFGDLWTSITEDNGWILTGALSIGSTLGQVLTGVFLAVFCLIFLLIDGEGIWRWLVRVFPKRAQPAVDGAGKTGWSTLSNYVRTQILVASIDAIGIGLGAFFLGLPLVLPIAVLVFLGAFIPIIGAVLTGAVAVFIALVYGGWHIALIMLAVVLVVQQLESHILQPLLLGSAVKVHPLAVVLVVAAGTMLAGIPGALFAVPIAAVINTMVRYVSSGRWRTGEDPSVFALDTGIWSREPRSRLPGTPGLRQKGTA